MGKHWHRYAPNHIFNFLENEVMSNQTKLPSADPNNADSRSATAVMEPPTSDPNVDTTDQAADRFESSGLT